MRRNETTRKRKCASRRESEQGTKENGNEMRKKNGKTRERQERKRKRRKEREGKNNNTKNKHCNGYISIKYNIETVKQTRRR